jgi:hypothetical protein
MKIKSFYLLILLAFLPNCIFRKSSRQYDCARAAYENVLYKYERDVHVFDAMQNSKDRASHMRLAQELKDEILLKNEEYNAERKHWFRHKHESSNYPFTQYKMGLDCNIELLEKTKAQLYWKQEGLAKSVQDLINTLDSMRKYIVLDSEYARERNMMERRKILQVEQEEHKKNIRTKKSVVNKNK